MMRLKHWMRKSEKQAMPENHRQSLHPIEKQLTEQFGFPMKVTINKNEAGSFRIPFHDREHMQTILEKLGCQSITLETARISHEALGRERKCWMIGKKLFAKIHKRKYHAHHNNEIHFMAREIDEWLPQGIQSIVDGSYTPRCLKRYYFTDEMVDQLHLSDRIFQHVLLKQLKPTFKHVMNPNCYHLDGPTGVKYATQRITASVAGRQTKLFYSCRY